MKNNDTKKKNNKGVKANETKKNEVSKNKSTKLDTKTEANSEKKADKKVVSNKNTSKTNSKVKDNKIKSGDIFLIVGLAIVVVLGFLLMGEKEAEPTYELPLTLSGEAGLHELSYQEYQEKIDNKEDFVVILERATCSHCVTYMPIAEDFAEENELPMYYVDTDTFTADEWDDFEKSISYLKKAKGKWGTPTTVVQSGYTTVDYVVGVTEEEELIELYNKYFDMEEE